MSLRTIPSFYCELSLRSSMPSLWFLHFLHKKSPTTFQMANTPRYPKRPTYTRNDTLWSTRMPNRIGKPATGAPLNISDQETKYPAHSLYFFLLIFLCKMWDTVTITETELLRDQDARFQWERASGSSLCLKRLTGTNLAFVWRQMKNFNARATHLVIITSVSVSFSLLFEFGPTS